MFLHSFFNQYSHCRWCTFYYRYPWTDHALSSQVGSVLLFFSFCESFHVTWRFITLFTTAHHCPISSVTLIQSTPSQYLIMTHFNIILQYMPWSSKWYLSHCHIKTLYTYNFSLWLPHALPITSHPILLNFTAPDNTQWTVQLMQLLTM